MLECVRQGNPGKQSNGERNQVLFTISECVLRAREGALQQSQISQEMSFASGSNDNAVDFEDYLQGQPSWLILQGPPGF